MNLVDNVNFVPGAAGSILYIAANFSNIVNVPVARPIDFQDVDILAKCDGPASVAGIAGSGGGSLLAVQGLGQDASRAGLTHAAGAGKEIGMGHPVAGQGVDQRLSNGLLAN